MPKSVLFTKRYKYFLLLSKLLAPVTNLRTNEKEYDLPNNICV